MERILTPRALFYLLFASAYLLLLPIYLVLMPRALFFISCVYMVRNRKWIVQ